MRIETIHLPAEGSYQLRKIGMTDLRVLSDEILTIDQADRDLTDPIALGAPGSTWALIDPIRALP